jgi:hypothetical protein
VPRTPRSDRCSEKIDPVRRAPRVGAGVDRVFIPTGGATMSAIELGRYVKGTKAERYHDCLEACVECVVACEVCTEHCLGGKDVQAMVECIRTCRDCVEACISCVLLLARGTERAAELCRTCAELCERCADECGSHDDEIMKRCAEACRRCAEECRKIAA